MQNTRLTEEMSALGLKVAGVGLGTVDYVNDTITLDQRAADLFGLVADTPITRDALHDRIHPEDRDDIDHLVEELLDPHGETFIEVTHRVIRDDGKIIWVNSRKEVTFELSADQKSLRPVSGLVAIKDVTALKESEQHARFLLAELNHRSKNLLAVVQSIARRTAASTDMDHFADKFAERISGLAHNYDALVRNNWQHADLFDLVTSHMSAFASEESERLTIDGPKVRMNPDLVQGVGMALHELATNASKYGALSNETGRVAIRWGAHDDDLVMTWEETGGPAVQEPERSGFGQMVIRDLAAASVNGSVDLQYRPEGVFWQLRLPMPEV